MKKVIWNYLLKEIKAGLDLVRKGHDILRCEILSVTHELREKNSKRVLIEMDNKKLMLSETSRPSE